MPYVVQGGGVDARIDRSRLNTPALGKTKLFRTQSCPRGGKDCILIILGMAMPFAGVHISHCNWRG